MVSLDLAAVPAVITYDIGISVIQLLMQAALTFLVVDRIVERQEERKRRTLSGLAESQILEHVEGLLADGLPLDCRRTDPTLLHIGSATVALRVSQIQWETLRHVMADPSTDALDLVDRAIRVHGDALRQPLNVSIVEPRLAPPLVRVGHSIEICRVGLDEQAEVGTTPESLDELGEAIIALCKEAWSLREQVRLRWA